MSIDRHWLKLPLSFLVSVSMLVFFLFTLYGCINPFIDRDKWFHILLNLETPLWIATMVFMLYGLRLIFIWGSFMGKGASVRRRMAYAIFCTTINTVISLSIIAIIGHYDKIDRRITLNEIIYKDELIRSIPGTSIYSINLDMDKINLIQGYASVRYGFGLSAFRNGEKVCAIYCMPIDIKEYYFESSRNASKNVHAQKIKAMDINELSSIMTDDDIRLLDIMTDAFLKYAEENIPLIDAQDEYENLYWGSSRLRKACITIMNNRKILSPNQ